VTSYRLDPTEDSSKLTNLNDDLQHTLTAFSRNDFHIQKFSSPQSIISKFTTNNLMNNNSGRTELINGPQRSCPVDDIAIK